ncbi:MAG: hypothetical protein J0H74_08130 [Chitinophagaceae bacterium]|nr:hypothetical protein [Chitinophagaceae bacterium]
MDTHIQMEERLWDYIDGRGTPVERSSIETLLAENMEWQRKYKELLNIHQMMQEVELDAPSMRFSKNVMEEIARLQVAPATKTYINKNIIRGIGAFFLAMIGGFLLFCLGQFKWSGSGSGPSSTFLPRYDLDIDTKMKTFNWGRIFNSAYTSIFVLVLVILGLVMLDMYLGNRKKQTA